MAPLKSRYGGARLGAGRKKKAPPPFGASDEAFVRLAKNIPATAQLLRAIADDVLILKRSFAGMLPLFAPEAPSPVETPAAAEAAAHDENSEGNV